MTNNEIGTGNDTGAGTATLDDLASAVEQIWQALTGRHPGPRLPDGSPGAKAGDVQASVRLVGDDQPPVAVCVTAGDAAARHLARQMTGQDATGADGFDAICELANQVGGIIKTLLPGRASIEPPSAGCPAQCCGDTPSGVSYGPADSWLHVCIAGRSLT